MSAPHAPTPGPEDLSPELHERLCAYLFDELEGDERRAFEAALEQDPALRAERARLEATLGLVRETLPEERLPDDILATLRAAAERGPEPAPRFSLLRGGGGARFARYAAAAAVLFVAGFFTLETVSRRNAVTGPADEVARGAPHAQALPEQEELGRKSRRMNVDADADPKLLEAIGYAEGEPAAKEFADEEALFAMDAPDSGEVPLGLEREVRSEPPSPAEGDAVKDSLASQVQNAPDRNAFAKAAQAPEESAAAGIVLDAERTREDGQYRGPSDNAPGVASGPTTPAPSAPPAARTGGKPVEVAGGAGGAYGGRARGKSELNYRGAARTLDAYEGGESKKEDLETLRGLGYVGDEEEAARLQARQELRDGRFENELDQDDGEDGFFQDHAQRRAVEPKNQVTPEQVRQLGDELVANCRIRPGERPADMFFRQWGEHPPVSAAEDALSTFSIDVDTASYTLSRRYLAGGELPPDEAVRTEEFVNYFKADRPAPGDGDAFSIGLEAAPTPFLDDPHAEMLRVTVRGKDVDAFDRQPLTLTFVVDVSGSMEDGGRLELVKESLRLLMTQLAVTDSVAIVSFRKEAHLVTTHVTAARRGEFEDLLESLVPEGGTNVQAGLTLGYEVASSALTPHSVNRVILLSDGVGNIGETDQQRLLEEVAGYRERGIYLNTIGVGMGNHDDGFLEQLADRGDGLCQYVDSRREAERSLVHEFTKTLQPIARDVKIQVEFDPAQVESYRQLGYENRAIADVRFRDDAVDAGEVNAGHQVTALYEIVRRPGASDAPFATARVRFKPPFSVDSGELGALAREEAERAVEIVRSIEPAGAAASFQAATPGFRRSVVVAQLAEVLRRSVHARGDSLDGLLAETRRLEPALADADFTEFLGLVETAVVLLRERDELESDPIVEVLDRLARMHYEAGRRELLGEDLPEEERLGGEEEAAERAEIERLEALVHRLLGARFLPQAQLETLQRLDELGYGEDER